MINVPANLRPLLVVLLALLIWLSLQFVNPVHAAPLPGTRHSILIKFNVGVSLSARTELVQSMQGEIVGWIEPLMTARVEVAGTEGALERLLAEIRQNAMVTSVEFDGPVSGIPTDRQATETVSRAGQNTIPASPVQVNDPDFNDPQRVYAPGMIELAQAWNYTMGAGTVVIATLDSGANAVHPDLEGRLIRGYDFVNEDQDPDDDHGHGTHVAGIIVATANNSVGSAGVCPQCVIMPVKVLDHNNVGTWSNVAKGIVYAVDNGARVINLSLGGNSSPQIIHDAVEYAAENDVLVVAAAGNSRTDQPFYPAALDAVVAVSATRQDDTRWSLSNFGEYIDVAAPGYAIFSTYADLENYYSGYTFMSGTSMAAPHVTGLAGLLLSQDASRSALDLRRIMLETADDLGEQGPDPEFGHGRINANNALTAGAPQPKADALLAGQVWQDINENGLWEQEEPASTSAVVIQVQNINGDAIGSSVVDGNGNWALSGLYPGTYLIRASAGVRSVITTDNERTVLLAESQQIVDLHFGTALIDEVTSTEDDLNLVFIPAVTKD